MTTSNVRQKTPGAYWKGQTVLNVRGNFNSTETDFLGIIVLQYHSICISNCLNVVVKG